MSDKKYIILLVLLIPFITFSQSDFEKILKGGEFLINGLSILKSSRSSEKVDSKVIESICVKNKLAEKITFRITGEDEDGNAVKKEMVIQKDGKECVFEVPKGIFTYEIVLPNKEIYKKGEYKFNDEVIITVKPE